MGGLFPLTWECVEAWKAVTGSEPTVGEVEILFSLDAVMCNPEPSPAEQKKEQGQQTTPQQIVKPWPSKKANAGALSV